MLCLVNYWLTVDFSGLTLSFNTTGTGIENTPTLTDAELMTGLNGDRDGVITYEDLDPRGLIKYKNSFSTFSCFWHRSCLSLKIMNKSWQGQKNLWMGKLRKLFFAVLISIAYWNRKASMDMLPVHLRDTTHAHMHSSSQSKSSFKLRRLSLIVCAYYLGNSCQGPWPLQPSLSTHPLPLQASSGPPCCPLIGWCRLSAEWNKNKQPVIDLRLVNITYSRLKRINKEWMNK